MSIFPHYLHNITCTNGIRASYKAEPTSFLFFFIFQFLLLSFLVSNPLHTIHNTIQDLQIVKFLGASSIYTVPEDFADTCKLHL